MTEPSILACDGVHKHFEEAGQRLEGLPGVELQVRAGETLAIIGASGSGKTTLLHILGGLDLPTRGTVRLMGQAFAELSDAARGVTKSFREGGLGVDVLRGADLDVTPGELVAFVGASGSGKTTLLQILGGLDLPSSGTVRITGQSLAELSDAARGTLRNRACWVMPTSSTPGSPGAA